MSNPIKNLYLEASKRFGNTGTEEEFKQRLENPQNRKTLYDALGKSGIGADRLGDYELFDKWISSSYENPSNVPIEEPSAPRAPEPPPAEIQQQSQEEPAPQPQLQQAPAGEQAIGIARKGIQQALSQPKPVTTEHVTEEQPQEVATEEPRLDYEGFWRLSEEYRKLTDDNKAMADVFQRAEERDKTGALWASAMGGRASMISDKKLKLPDPDEKYRSENAGKWNEYKKQEAQLRQELASHPVQRAAILEATIDAEEQQGVFEEQLDKFKANNADALFTAKARSLRGAAGMRAVGPSREQMEILSQKKTLEDAISLNKRTQQLLKAPRKDDDSNAFANYVKGVAAKGTDLDFWTFGLTEIARNLNIRDVAMKLQKEEEAQGVQAEHLDLDTFLTEPEKALLSAFYDNLQASALRSEDLSMGYQAGMTAMDSAKFMAEFIVTGGVTKAATKGVTRAIERWLIGKASTKAGSMLAKGLAVSLRSAIEAAVRLPLHPSTYQNVAQQLITYDEDGKLQSNFNAIKDGLIDHAIELYSESMGDHLVKVVTLPFSQLLDALPNTTVSQLYKQLQNSPVHKLLKQGQWHGLFGEMLEEWYGNLLRAAAGHPEELKQYATVEQQLITLAAFAPTTVIGGIASTAQYSSAQNNFKNSSLALRAIMADAGYESEQTEYLIDQIMNTTPRQIAEKITPVVNQVAVDNDENGLNLYMAFTEFIKAKCEMQAFDGVYEVQHEEMKQDTDAALQARIGEYTNKNKQVEIVQDAEGGAFFVVSDVTDAEEPIVILKDFQGNEKMVSKEQYNKEYSPHTLMGKDAYLSNIIMLKDQAELDERKRQEGAADLLNNVSLGEPAYFNINGEVVQGTPQAITPDGDITVHFRDHVDVLTPEEYQQLVMETVVTAEQEAQVQQQQIEALQKEEEQAQKAVEQTREEIPAEEAPAPTEAETTPVEEVPEEETAAEQQVDLPLTKNGEVDYDVLLDQNPEQFAKEITKELGEETAVEMMSVMAKQIDAEIGKLQKQAEKAASATKAIALRKQIAALQNRRKALTSLIAQSSQQTQQEVTQVPPAQVGQVGQNITEKWNNTPKQPGNEETFTLPNGQQIKGRWILTEAQAVTPSHNPHTLQTSEGFPATKDGKNINDNDYTKKVAEVETMSQGYDGRAIDHPVFIQDGVVLSGNNRVMSGILAAERGTDTKYREALAEKASKMGFTSEQISQFTNPRLFVEVSERLPLTTETFALFNQRETKSKTPTERAIVVSKRDNSHVIGLISRELDGYEKLSDLYQNQGASTAVAKYLIEGGLVNQNELPELFENGSFTSAGKDFLESVLVGSVMKEDQVTILATDGMKNVRQRIVKAIVPLIENSKIREDGRIINDINKGILYLYKARQGSMTLRDYFLQADMFNPATYDIDGVHNALMLQGTEKDFRDYVLLANKELKDPIADMFTGEVRGKKDLYSELEKKYDNEQRSTVDAARAANALAGGQSGADATSQDQGGILPGTQEDDEPGGPGIPATPGEQTETSKAGEEPERDLEAALENAGDKAPAKEVKTEEELERYFEEIKAEQEAQFNKFFNNLLDKWEKLYNEEKFDELLEEDILRSAGNNSHYVKPFGERIGFKFPSEVNSEKEIAELKKRLVEHKRGKSEQEGTISIFEAAQKAQEEAKAKAEAEAKAKGQDDIVSIFAAAQEQQEKVEAQAKKESLETYENIAQEKITKPKMPVTEEDYLKVLKNVTANDELRPVMAGVFFDAENKNIVATNTMALVKIPSNLPTESKVLAARKWGEQKIGDVVEGKFPDYLAVIPKNYERFDGRFNVATLLGQTNTLIAETKARIKQRAEIEGRLTDDQIATEHAAKFGTAFFDLRHIATGLRGLYDVGSTYVIAYASVDNRPMTFVDALNPERLALVMPIMVDEEAVIYEGAPPRVRSTLSNRKIGIDRERLKDAIARKEKSTPYWEASNKEYLEKAKAEGNTDSVKHYEEEIKKDRAKHEAELQALKDLLEGKEETKDAKSKSEEKKSAIQAEADKVDTSPSEAQKEAGNYQKGHITVQGFDITIENPKGSIRSGVDAKGNEWSSKLNHNYGYFRRTEGKDGDHVDVFVGESPLSEKIFVVDQVNPETKEFDESKVMIGFDSIEEAQKAYLSNYEQGWQGMGTVTEVNLETFKNWLYRGTKQQKPFSEYEQVKSETSRNAEQKEDTEEEGEKPEDFGEKIGGARKDMDITRRHRKTDDLPAWRRKYFLSNIGDEGSISLSIGSDVDESKPITVAYWVERIVYGKKKKDMKLILEGDHSFKPKMFGSIQEAEDYIPIYEVKKQNYVIHENKDGEFVIVKRSSTGKLMEFDVFPTRKEALVFLRSTEGATSLLNRKKESFSIPELDRVQRTGKDYRNGKDITTQEFKDAFGFRGGEFGNWVKNDERQAMLNMAYDALMDLSDMLGIKPRALSFGGELGIAFGSRGSGSVTGGSAVAHYEPLRAVINLTRMRGAGSLAHEWAHALDNYFGLQAVKTTYAKNEEGEVKAGRKMRSEDNWAPGMREELNKVFNAIVKRAQEKLAPKEVAVERLTKAAERIGNRVKEEADDLIKALTEGRKRYKYNRSTKKHEHVHLKATEADIAKAKGLLDIITSGKSEKPDWMMNPNSRATKVSADNYAYINKEIKALDNIFKKTFGFTGVKRDGAGFYNLTYFTYRYHIALEELERTKTQGNRSVVMPTEYYDNSKKYDRGRATPYWSRETELFARAFEYFIQEKLRDRGEKSDYLQYDKAPIYQRLYKISPYPSGEDRLTLNAMFQQFFDIIKEKGDEDGNVILYRSAEEIRQDQEVTEAGERQIQGLEDYTHEEIKELAQNYINEVLSDIGEDAEIVDLAIVGSRERGTAREDSDLDIVVEYRGKIREDGLFNALNEYPLIIDGVQVDINPINAEKSGTLQEFLKKNDRYLEETAREQYDDRLNHIKEQAIKDGTFMKAPNGKPTNLTERQWLQVRTQEFKNWFGNWESDQGRSSQVVDENGEPKVVYHDTDAKREVFDTKHVRKAQEIEGHFFAPEADTYHKYGPVRNPVFLNIREGADRIEAYKGFNEKQVLSLRAGSEQRAELEKKGFDGGIITEDGKVIEYFVFNSDQIKSAEENVGTFDAENDNIRYRKGKDTYYVEENYTPKGMGVGFYLRFTENPQEDIANKYSRWYIDETELGWEKDNGAVEGKDFFFDDEAGMFYKKHTGLSGHALEAENLSNAILEVEKSNSWFRNQERDSWAIFEDEYNSNVAQDTPEGSTFFPKKVLFYREYDNSDIRYRMAEEHMLQEAPATYSELPEDQIPKETQEAYKLMRYHKDKPGLLYPLYAKDNQDGKKGFKKGVWYKAEEQSVKIGGKDLAHRPGLHAVNLPLFLQGKTQAAGETRVWTKVLMPATSEETQKESDTTPLLTNGQREGIRSRLIGPSEAYNFRTNPNATGADAWPIAGSMMIERVLSDAQVREILENAGKQDLADQSMTGDPDIRFRKVDQAGFYSTVENALEALPQEKGTPEQMKAMLLKNGAKEAELDWMGWDDFIRTHPRKEKRVVTKEDVKNWIKRERISIIDYINKPPHARYEAYTEPGGSNYREVLLRFPNNELYYNLIDAESGNVIMSSDDKRVLQEEQEGLKVRYPRLVTKIDESKETERRYSSPHFSGVTNIVAHIRLTDRMINGEKVLFIEELQSDWAQEGRKRGFIGKELDTDKSFIEYRNSLFEKYNVITTHDLKKVAERDEVTTIDNLYARENGGMMISPQAPDMPFKKTDQWVNLAMRKLMRYAAENGFDRIAWTNGEQQVERYDLSKHFNKIVWIPGNENTDGRGRLESFDKDGRPVVNQTINPSDLADYVGKEMAESLLNSTPDENGMVVREGLDLKVGGEGMKAFYDNIIPKAASKIGKAFGASIEEIPLTATTRDVQENAMGELELSQNASDIHLQFMTALEDVYDSVEDLYPVEEYVEDMRREGYIVELDDEGRPIGLKQIIDGETSNVQSLPVTPAMKASVQEGVPLFRESKGGVFTNRVIARNQIEELAEKLNLKVAIVNKDDLTREKQKDSRGFYDISADKITIVIDNHKTTDDALKTLLHEAVAHKGLRELFGKDFDGFLDHVYQNADKDVREAIGELISKNDWSVRIATEEYLAALAESTDYNKNESLWTKIKNFFMDLLRKAGFQLNTPLTDADMRYILQRSYDRMVDKEGRGGVFDIARDAQIRSRVGLNDKVDPVIKAEKDKIIKTAKKDGSYMKAPNGEKSNLTPEQWVTARTQDFRRWFGDWTKTLNLEEELSKAPKDSEPTDFNAEKAPFMAVLHRANQEAFDENGEPLAKFQDEYYRQVEDPIQRAEVDKAREAYDKRLDETSYKIQEAFQDSMLALKVLQQEVSKASGKDIQLFEDAYTAENHVSSKNLYEKEFFQENYFKPIPTAIHALAKKIDGTYQDIVTYAMARHGLERNVVLAMRDAQRTVDQIKAEMVADAKAKLKKNKLTEEEYYDTVGAINVEMEELLDEYFEKNRERDYAGITALFPYASPLDGAPDLAMSEQMAQSLTDEVERSAGEEARELWNRVNAATKKSLLKLYETGIMTRSVYEKVRDMYGFYVPLRGFAEQTAEDMYEYLMYDTSPFSAPLLGAKGRKSIADDPFATIGTMAESAIQQGNRNWMKQKFLNMALNHKSDLLSVKEVWYINEGTQEHPEWRQSIPELTLGMSAREMTEAFEKFEERMQDLASERKATKVRSELNTPYRTLGKQATEHAVLVKSAGKDYAVFVNGNPRAAQAINGLTNADTSKERQVMMRVNRWLSANYTTRSPQFMIRNLFRDATYSLFAISIKEGKEYNRTFRHNLGRNYVDIWKLMGDYRNGKLDTSTEKGRFMMEFLENGGETGYTALKRVDEYKKIVGDLMKEAQGNKLVTLKNVGMTPFKQIGFANRCIEDICRFSAFMTSRQMGREIEQSIADAKEVTVNFNRKGSHQGYGSGLLSSLYLFFNAGVQGMDNISRVYKKNPLKASIGTVSILTAGALVPYFNMVLSSVLGGDPEEYLNMPEWIRRNHLVIGGNGFYITIPLAIEIRAIYGIGDIAYMACAGRMKDKNIFGEIVGQFADILPMDPVDAYSNVIHNWVPDAVAPIFDNIMNEDFTKKPIFHDSDWNRYYPSYTKAYAGTNKAFVKASGLLNQIGGGDEYTKGWIESNITKVDLINPAKWEHLLEGYFGGMLTAANQAAKTVSMAWDPDQRMLRNVPLVSVLFQHNDKTSSYNFINNMYHHYREEHDKTRQSYTKYKLEPEKYGDKLDKLMDSDKFRRYEIYESYKKDIQKIEAAIKDAVDDIEIKDLRQQLNELKGDLVDDLLAND